MAKKIDIMNMRKDEDWRIIDGKTQRVEREKVIGPTIKNAITDVKIKETVTPKRSETIMVKKEEGKKTWKKKSKKT